MDNRIGDARREYAARVGKFTQEDAAKFFGVSLSTYKKWEQGQGMMNGEQLRELAMKYDVTTDYLLDRKVSYSVVSLDDDLTDDEKELLKLFRSLPLAGKHAVIVGLRDFAEQKGKE